jgi:carboxypeptidase C (cathepsin A)
LEQPVGVGFSYGGPEPVNEDEVSGDVYAWLMNFYQVFEEYQNSPLYFFGESYAGMYVPSIAQRIHQENLKLEANVLDGVFRSHVNLAGIALGNGLVDAKIQGPAVLDYAYWHGMIDAYTRDNLRVEWNRCISMGSAYHPEPPFHSFNAPDDCAIMEAVLEAAGKDVLTGKGFNFPLESGPNTYDVTTWDPYRIIGSDYNSSNQLFFNNPRVKELLHAPADTVWMGCLPGSGRRRRRDRRRRKLILDDDRPLSTVPYIAELLDAGIRVLVYNGDRDLSTCAQGTEAYLNIMEWNGMNEWKKAARALWLVPNDVTRKQEMGGYAKEHLGLSFVVVYNSGHMVRASLYQREGMAAD